jgi:predicted TIM-barrel fold metal-dependent hydrolase
MEIIDVHSHIGRSRDGAYQAPGKTLQAMREFRVARSIVFPIDEKDPGPSYVRMNRLIARLARKNPSLIGCARLNPNELDFACREINFASKNDFRAVKLHPRSDCFNVELAAPLFQSITENRLAVILHTGHEPNCHPNDWLYVFKSYPKTFFILAHSGKDVYAEAIEIAKELANVYLDTSTLSYYRTGVILKRAGAGKVVFASDIPYSHLGLEIQKFKFLLPNRKKQRQVFSGNIRRILEL